MQLQQQQQGWTDSEVDQVLLAVGTIEQSQATIEIATVNITEFIDAITMAIFFLVLIAGMNYGYMISHYFLPKPKDIAP